MTRRELEEGMRKGIRLARDAALPGNYGAGAVVPRNGTVIGESGSGLVEGGDPTGHPETQAIRMAAEHPDDTFTWRQIDIRAQGVVRAGHPRPEVHEEVCRDACLELIPLTARRDTVGDGAKTG